MSLLRASYSSDGNKVGEERDWFPSHSVRKFYKIMIEFAAI